MMETEKDKLRRMRSLLATGKAADRQEAQIILASIGRATKHKKREAANQQTRLF